MKTTTLTTEFLFPATIPDRWLQDLTRVWNQSVFYLNWLQHYKRAEACSALDLPPVEIKVIKSGDDWVYSCPIGRDARLDKTKSWDSNNVEFRHCVNLVNPVWLTKPMIDNYSAIDLRKPFAKKRCDWLQESDIPQLYVNDFIGLVVIPSWEAYRKGDRGKPRYRNKDRDRVRSIVSESFRAQCKISNTDFIKLPGFDQIEIHGLYHRLVKPIEQMCEQMCEHPESSESFRKKLEKNLQESRRKLAKDQGLALKELDEAAIAKLDEQIDIDLLKTKTLEYFSSPGSFCLIQRDGKTYLQITAEMPVQDAKPTGKKIGVDTGKDLLIDGTNGLRVDHLDFSKIEARIQRLQQVLSKKKPGSNNYKKLQEQIRTLQGKIKRERKARQAFYASQIADVYDDIKVKEVNVKASIARPVPIPDGEGYACNGAERISEENKRITDAAIGQFVLLLKNQANKRDRAFEKVKVKPDAPPKQILETSKEESKTSLSAREMQTPTERAGGAERQRKGKGNPTLPIDPTQVPELVNLANTPRPIKRKRRNRIRERKIG